MAPGEFRCRICYRKTGRLRFLSHLEVTHAIERAARRAGLPYAVTKGFNPHMKVGFGPALPTGTAGEREYLDIWLAEYVPAEQLISRLTAVSPVDLAPNEVRYVGMGEPSLTAACNIGVYEVLVEGSDGQAFEKALGDVVAGGKLTVEHKGKTKVFDLALSLPKEPCARSTEQGLVVEITTRMGPEGSLRPESLVSAALSRGGAPGAVRSVTRCDTLIETEEGFVRPI